MPGFIDFLDRNLRRNAALPRMVWLRKLLRQPYHRLLRQNRSGLSLNVGGALPIRVPGEFCSKEQEHYERETALAIRRWSDRNPGGLFVDIGSSYGYFSCGVLFNDPAAIVLAIDADLPSLAITRHVCQYASEVNLRLSLLRTLIAGKSSSSHTLASLVDETRGLLSDPRLTLDPAGTNYVNLDTRIPENELPRITLDDLLGDLLGKRSGACLIKCDVEGAELLVLQGAPKVLSQYRPDLLVSVHPPFLPRFGATVEDVRGLLAASGYSVEVLAVDHEEHWWCHAG